MKEVLLQEGFPDPHVDRSLDLPLDNAPVQCLPTVVGAPDVSHLNHPCFQVHLHLGHLGGEGVGGGGSH